MTLRVPRLDEYLHLASHAACLRVTPTVSCLYSCDRPVTAILPSRVRVGQAKAAEFGVGGNLRQSSNVAQVLRKASPAVRFFHTKSSDRTKLSDVYRF